MTVVTDRGATPIQSDDGIEASRSGESFVHGVVPPPIEICNNRNCVAGFASAFSNVRISDMEPGFNVSSTLYRSKMHYEKHLVRVGNSLGIVLDQPVLRAMGLGRKTRVRVRTDGYLIVIEPAQKPAFEAGRVTREVHSIRLACALDTARALGDSLSPDQMAELGAGRVLLSSYSMMLARKTSFDARWLVLIERLDHVRQAIDASRNTVEAIAAAVEAVPGGPYEGRLS